MCTNNQKRECRLCNQYKTLEHFSSNGRKNAVENRCKECIKLNAWIRRELKKTAPPKPNKCECCGKQTDVLCIDHCHNSLEFRGWICAPCNRGIGQLGDNIEGIKKALTYLEKCV